MRTQFAAAVGGFLVLAAPGHAADNLAGLESCLSQAAHTLKFNGIVRIQRGTTVLQRVFGTADQRGTVPITSDTRFNIASAGKMFTAIGVAQLAERGLLSLDDPVGKYLSGVTPQIAKITIRQLLSHTSGLGDYLDPANRAVIEHARTAAALLPLALAGGPAFEPGTKFAYSNSGYVVLGAIIESVSRQSYAAYLQHAIFDPAGMNDTSMDTANSADPMTRMSPEGMLATPLLSPLRLPFASPAGGEVSTAADISRFLEALRLGKLASATTRQVLFTPVKADANINYALGFNVVKGPPLMVGHGGGAPGINAEIALLPASGWEVVALSNNDPPIASRLASVLEQQLFAPNPGQTCGMALSSAQPSHDPVLLTRP
jgi:D-alanyl-D-alanine carboxypeptidase